VTVASWCLHAFPWCLNASHSLMIRLKCNSVEGTACHCWSVLCWQSYLSYLNQQYLGRKREQCECYVYLPDKYWSAWYEETHTGKYSWTPVKRKWCDQGTDGWHGGCRSESIIVCAVLLLNYRVLILSDNNLLTLPVLLRIILLQPIQQRPIFVAG
jgi:hypothetical protein